MNLLVPIREILIKSQQTRATQIKKKKIFFRFIL